MRILQIMLVTAVTVIVGPTLIPIQIRIYTTWETDTMDQILNCFRYRNFILIVILLNQ